MKQSKKPTLRKFLLENRNMPLAEALVEAPKVMGRSITVGSLWTTRWHLRKAGHELPTWEVLGRRPRLTVKLDSKQAAAMKEIWKNRQDSNQEIQQILAQQGKKVSKGTIQISRLKMMKWFPKIDFLKKLELSAEQLAMIPQFKTLIHKIFWSGVAPTLNWPIEALRDLESFAIGRIPWLIKNYDKTRSTIKYYLGQRLTKSLKPDYVKISLKHGLGISWKETAPLIKIKREKSQSLQDHAKIAEKLKCSKNEVDSLWKAYQSFRIDESRTGRKDEQ